MDTQPVYPPETMSFSARNKNLIKGLMISALILLLLIPTYFIGDIIRERQQRNEEVKQEIESQWSKSQTICGPILVIPFYETTKDQAGKVTSSKQNAYFLPDKLNINTRLLPELKSRSIFKVPVYNSSIAISGSFAPIDAKSISVSPENLIYNEANLVFGITDFKGLQEQTKIEWDNASYNFSIGEAMGVTSSGENMMYATNLDRDEVVTTNRNAQALRVTIPLDASSFEKGHEFSMKLNLRGTEKIFFTPVGTNTKVNLDAKWKDRDFKGNYLPDNHPLTDTGFTANWTIYRSLQPQQKYGLSNLDRTTFGVNLIQPLDNYAKTTRTIKYAILVIMLTFVVYFFIEVFQKKHVHAGQYVLIGFALCMFYTLLLSISEYVSFQHAYYIAGFATVGLISLYTKSVFNSNKTAGIFGGFLVLLYTFIFILIQLQDGALLAGSIGLFSILAAIMYFSRKLEWYSK